MIKILKYGEVENTDIFARGSVKTNVEGIVSEIIENVKTNGDKALFEYCEKFDKAKLSSFAVSADEIENAVKSADEKFINILKKAAANIRKFHEKQVRTSFIINDENGIVTGQKIIPVDCAGLYVPGGTAAYPSTVLMDAIPAKIAGVKNLVMVTPPRPDGSVNPVILAAAHIAGIDKLSDWLGMSLVKKDFCCFLMKHNNFPAFLDIDFIDKTSFEKLHDFYLCMIGIYAGKVQADVFLSETKINASLPHGCSGLDDMIREIMTGSIHVFIVQLHPSSFFQSVV